MKQWMMRIVGILMAVLNVRMTLWVMSALNPDALWLAVPFAAAMGFLTVNMTLVSINNWTQKVPPTRFVGEGNEPNVAVIIPTRGEIPDMVMKTVKSVFSQDYPVNKMLVIVSDDAHNGALRAVLYKYRYDHPEIREQLVYFDPPKNGSPERKGEAKSGNLNAVLAFLAKRPDIEYIETRDCDDMVGNQMFLSECIGQLQADPKLGFVQTIKEANVPPGDPFGNLDLFFYHTVMKARYATNSVFPCGSGVVFRRAALDSIGGFPTWNLVEDLEVGVQLLAKGWVSMYLPIVGTVAQNAPEDIENVLKQRGTWATDTLRLFIWKNPILQNGLSVRQRLSFSELGMFYLLSFTRLVVLAIPITALNFHIYPLVATQTDYILNLWPAVIANEIFILLLAPRLSYEQIWTYRQQWQGLSVQYVKAFFTALLYGSKKKPAYHVTRKTRRPKWYWREVFVQTLLLIALLGSMAQYLSQQTFTSLLASGDIGSMFWAMYFAFELSGIVTKSWYGVTFQVPKLSMSWLFRPRYALATMIAMICVSLATVTIIAFGRPAVAVEPLNVQSIPPVQTPSTFLAQLGPVLRPGVSEPEKNTLTDDTLLREIRKVAPNRTLTINPQGRVGLGLYTNVDDSDFSFTKRFESLVEHKMFYTMWFQAWGDADRDFQSSRVMLARDNGYIPIITWEPWKRNFQNQSMPQPEYSFARINSGAFDSYIRSWAKAAAATKAPLIIRFAHEQSSEPGTTPWYPWQGDPEGYKAAFRRIVAIFRQEGATNAKFLWSGMWIYSNVADKYYPGDDAVDFIGTTVVNHSIAISAPWAAWRPFWVLFGEEFQTTADKWNKPIIVTEVGSAEQGGDKAAWLSDTFGSLRSRYPLIVGMVLLEITSDRELPAINWSVTSSETSLNAFKEVIKDSHFK